MKLWYQLSRTATDSGDTALLPALASGLIISKNIAIKIGGRITNGHSAMKRLGYEELYIFINEIGDIIPVVIKHYTH